MVLCARWVSEDMRRKYSMRKSWDKKKGKRWEGGDGEEEGNNNLFSGCLHHTYIADGCLQFPYLIQCWIRSHIPLDEQIAESDLLFASPRIRYHLYVSLSPLYCNDTTCNYQWRTWEPDWSLPLSNAMTSYTLNLEPIRGYLYSLTLVIARLTV